MSLTVSLDQLVPFSQARAGLADLLDGIKRKEYVVISRKYQPAAILANIKFFDKVLRGYKAWQKEKTFDEMMRVAIRNDINEKQVMKDALEAIAAVRKNKNNE